MRPHAFIALEGLSGTGKSEVAVRLAREIGGVVYKTPAEPFGRIRDEIDRVCGLQERYFFYLASVLHASSEIRKLTERSPVVCDRYILTTQVYHRAVGVANIVDEEQLNLYAPTLTVLLTCEPDERERRLSFRGRSYNDIQERKLGIDDAFLQAYRTREVFEVDTTNRDPDAVVSCILARIGGSKGTTPTVPQPERCDE